jgi:hypothetical protein
MRAMKKGFSLAFGASLAVIAGVAGGCGGAAFTSGGDASAGPTVEAGIEAAAEAGDAAPSVEAGEPWCASLMTKPTFCEDFDEYTSVTTMLGSNTWPVFSQSNGSFQFDTVNAPSPPNALEANGADDSANVLIVHTFTGFASPMNLRLSFDLRINSGGMPGLLSVAGIAAIAFGTSINNGYVALAIGDGPSLDAFWVQSTGNVLDGGVSKPAPLSGSFPAPGVWVGTYIVEVSYATTPTGCLQIYNGEAPQMGTCLVLPPEFADPKVLSIALGDVAGGGAHTGMINVEFDNVTFDIK